MGPAPIGVVTNYGGGANTTVDVSVRLYDFCFLCILAAFLVTPDDFAFMRMSC